ncbi:MAG: HNH endonuclease signature motif containing protein [Bacteroidales bacterium]|nr:HNH endonuclease signature motif containing protein [Bacteroidales bacterium]
MKYTFRDFKIERNCDKHYSDYRKYKPYLEMDFKKRCAYCNLHEEMITSYFEVDHFVPRKEFEKGWLQLETDYNNLMLSCPKCNKEKGSAFRGDLSVNYDNDLFYNPVDHDYNTVFFRDEFCGIASNDKKGNEMIVLLKLYRPIHNLAGICDFSKRVIEKIEVKLKLLDVNCQDYKKLHELKNELKSYYSDCRDVFTANYNNKEFEIE